MHARHLPRKWLSTAFAAFAGLVNAQAPDWPELPTRAFMAGRPATQVDVNEGRAVFVIAVDGVSIGQPIAITIPQYAFLAGDSGGFPMPVVVVHAEEFPKGKLVGVRDAKGKEYVANLSDLKLLVTTKPASEHP